MGNPKKNRAKRLLKRIARKQYRSAESAALDKVGRDQRPRLEHEQPPTSLKAKSLPLIEADEHPRVISLDELAASVGREHLLSEREADADEDILDELDEDE